MASLRFRRGLREYRGILTFLLCMLVFRSALADWNDVPSGSMQPTIRIGDRIVVDKLAYDLRVPFSDVSLWHRADPRRGDIVVVDSSAARRRLVKRVIGLPGDTVALRDNRLWINGRPVGYRALPPAGLPGDGRDGARYAWEQLDGTAHAVRWSRAAGHSLGDFATVRVPAGRYLLLGDDRDNSADSRYYGFFARDEIVGRSRWIALSLDHDHHYLPRTGRFGLALDQTR